MISVVAFGSFWVVGVWEFIDGWIKTVTQAQATLGLGDLKVFAAGYRALAKVVGMLGRGPPPAWSCSRCSGALTGRWGWRRGIDLAREPHVPHLVPRDVEGSWPPWKRRRLYPAFPGPQRDQGHHVPGRYPRHPTPGPG